MRAFACPVCNTFTAFESDRCGTCRTALGLHLPTKSMQAVADGAAQVDGQRWVRCTQNKTVGCNWLALDEQSPLRPGPVPGALADPPRARRR